MASTSTTVGQLISALSTLPSTDIISWFHHGSSFDKNQLSQLQAELSAYATTKAGNAKAQSLLPAAQFALQTLQTAINGDATAAEILQAANAAEAAVNAVGAA